ncbi:MotA/TolQ/ExbB proton channel family protein [Moritella sp. Urea-trap-13]|uniref:MotA/TolQ/ExbB proton channel family protein n=1 Tax=Moritella sp. Urea-trap-13 TaxID=2058327 RepID=UPI000C32FA6D|nr:MotA/TolQ/ExbB proton channel family protein [Moritella sp. Urea-trap-13]PKH04768.1 hypothetical protein CXF93_21370 [Moritella sp. Urea-trap-13]
MLASSVENILQVSTAETVAELVCYSILIAFATSIFFAKKNRFPAFVNYTPSLLTTIGIFGTFTGIAIGLLMFDHTNIDGSISELLAGLKTAFITSLFGIFTSILFKVLQSLGLLESKEIIEDEITEATPVDILNAIKQQGRSIERLVNTIGGEQDKSLVNLMQLMRSDINDNQKSSIKFAQESSENLIEINTKIEAQHNVFNQFSDELWIKMQDFSDMLSKSATETVIEALKQVITDFNHNLTEQFGENFKQLNESVKELVKWQDNYKDQLSDMIEQYKQGVVAITETEKSVANISTESKIIPSTMNDLKEVMTVNKHQLDELERHLEAFKDIRDKAVEAVPEIRKQIDETVSTITESVNVASEHYKTLLTESDKYIQTHISTSNELLDKFVSNSKEGVETIGERLAESANQVEKVILSGAEHFETNVKLTNEKLKETTHAVSDNTLKIREELDHTVKELSLNVRDMVNGLIEDSKRIGTTLIDANSSLKTETTAARDHVVESIDNMQKSLESSLEGVYQQQSQHMQQMFNNIDKGLREQVSKTGDVVEGQVGAIDKAMQDEITRVMNTMGNNLGQITEKFTSDYTDLVNQMNAVVKQRA